MAGWQERGFSRFAGVDARRLIVVVHGIRGSNQRMASVADAALKALGAADAYIPAMPYGGALGPLSSAPPARVVCDLAAAIDALDADRRDRLGTGYDRIILIGHSLGALVIRKLAIIAHGESASAPFEAGYEDYAEGRPWGERIERIVLLGGISRGWSPGSASSWLIGFLWGLFAFLATLLPTRRGTIMESRFGFPFPVQTRLQWLALVRDHGRDLPVVQLLGSRDDLVSPDDMIDVTIDSVAKGSHVLLDVPGTAHLDVISMGEDTGDSTRRRLMRDALLMDMDELRAHAAAISSALLADGGTPRVEDHITDVVFVVHGIRDKGFWTSKVARAIKREAYFSSQGSDSSTQERHVRSMSESYGYLAMLPFLWIGIRRAKAAWLMDRYVDARARYPMAKIHFVGHSNGTYLAARALHDYPAAIFERIVFAGSVVRANFQWKKLIDAPRPQVRGVLNYVASMDLVVGIFPAALGIVDLGSAGHKGFRDLGDPSGSTDVPRVARQAIGNSFGYQVRYVRGGHGAGIVETQWDEIARFVISGEAPQDINSDYVGRQSVVARVLGAVPLLTLLLLLALYGALAWAAFTFLPLWGMGLFVLVSLVFLFRF